MEKSSADDDCVDSGAETGGSDYSPLSSTSSELSMGELQDPFLVSVHLIADPGQGKRLQRAADGVLAWVHPELQLFRVSERASGSQRHRSKRHQNGSPAASCQPALAVILFLQEAYGGEEQILVLHRTLQRPPWRYHHTEKVSNGRRMLPLTPCSQDFFTLSPGTPLWAVRQVHYGKEIVRFTVYCRYENYVDMVRLYKLLLQRRVAQKKEDFCFFVVYSNPDMEIQLSFKRLPRGQCPSALDSAVMEVRVRDVGALVPLLPHPCSPISEVRWQTEDYDGNKILLQVQAAHFRQDSCHLSSPSLSQHPLRPPSPAAPPPTETAGTTTGQFPFHVLVSWTLSQPPPQEPLPQQELFSDPALPAQRGRLIGAEETDVDTGNKVNPGSSVDLTVVSAYIKSSLPQTSRPLSAPPEDIGPSLFPGIPENSYRAATLGRTPNRFCTHGDPPTFMGPHIQGTSVNTSAALSLSDVSINHSDSCSIISAPIEEEDKAEEDVQEFYI
ncbi:hypothetical protein Q5P01_013844 [Channa striata]|uniref:FAM124 domain-containing protein n=1 Tax=Channa striata TaxID=64152 RepID=A0AA88SKT6_CHASR|nr:hypothetical protein Q5P01_013844 [Channa striata]